MTEYMLGAWVEEPMYLIRMFGQGENVVKSGDLVADVLSGSQPHPDGPMWLGQRAYDALTKAQRKELKQMGVTDIRLIPTEVCHAR